MRITGTYDKKAIKYQFFVKVKKKELDIGVCSVFTFEFELFEPKSLCQKQIERDRTGDSSPKKGCC